MTFDRCGPLWTQREGFGGFGPRLVRSMVARTVDRLGRRVSTANSRSHKIASLMNQTEQQPRWAVAVEGHDHDLRSIAGALREQGVWLEKTEKDGWLVTADVFDGVAEADPVRRSAHETLAMVNGAGCSSTQDSVRSRRTMYIDSTPTGEKTCSCCSRVQSKPDPASTPRSCRQHPMDLPLRRRPPNWTGRWLLPRLIPTSLGLFG